MATVATAFLTSCGGSIQSASPSNGPDLTLRTELDCERDGYPCTRAEVDPAVLEREATYVAAVTDILVSGTPADALEWVRDQEGVLVAEADERSVYFRLEGGQPVPILLMTDQGLRPRAATSVALRPEIGLASAVTPVDAAAGDSTRDIVGFDTDRDHRQNLKRALILTPFAWQGMSMRLPGERDPVEMLREIPDYDHDADSVLALTDDQVTPASLTGWSRYDVVFLQTHGGVYEGDRVVLATGAKERFRVEVEPRPPATPAQPSEAAATRPITGACEAVISAYRSMTGVLCLPVVHTHTVDGVKTTESWVTAGVLPEFWQEEYSGGLDKTIVYLGGCHSIRATVADGQPDDEDGGPNSPDGADLPVGIELAPIARTLAGQKSAFIGWNNAVYTESESKFAWALLNNLILSRRTIHDALTATCFEVGCSGDNYDARAKIAATPAARELRLHDLPTLRHPGRDATTSAARLRDGAMLEVIGTPGDGQHDELAIEVDVFGVYDAPVNYSLTFEIDGYEPPMATDSLGPSSSRTKWVREVGPAAYRYSDVLELPFDVDPGGTPATLRVTVDLPEGGTSDYEVDVVLGSKRTACEIIGRDNLQQWWDLAGSSEQYRSVNDTELGCILQSEFMLLSAVAVPFFELTELTASEYIINDLNRDHIRPMPAFSEHAFMNWDPDFQEALMYFEHREQVWLLSVFTDGPLPDGLLGPAEFFLERLGGPDQEPDPEPSSGPDARHPDPEPQALL